MSNNIKEALQFINDRVACSNSKHYWMVRTDDGKNYSTFVENRFVALSILNFPTALLHEIVGEYQTISVRKQKIREQILQLNDNGVINIANRSGIVEASSLSRLANQIYNLCFGMQKGDIVVIPDAGARRLCIGRVTDTQLTANPSENSLFSLVRSVEWIKEIKRTV